MNKKVKHQASQRPSAMAGTIKSCGESLLTIINDILDFSKIESGKLTIEKTPFAPKSLVDELIYLFSEPAHEKNIKFEEVLDPEMPGRFIGDATRIRQIVSNFISNAIKFTPENGQVTIKIGSTAINKEMAEISIAVIDNGIGIKKKDRVKLFQAFTQADVSTTRKFGGTGLGLAICAKLVELMNGEIELDSEFGKGTTFVLKIPLEIEEFESVTDLAAVKSIEVKRVDSQLPTDAIRILLVEDNKINQKIAELMIKKAGFKCDIAENGIEALAALENQGDAPYNIVFMDMMMPEMDGLTATRKIVEKYGDAKPKIIAMTANVFQEDREKCFSAGMDDFLAKPLLIADVKRVIAESFDEMISSDKAPKLLKIS